MPRWFNVLIPPHRQQDGKVETVPNVTMSAIDAKKAERTEAGLALSDSSDTPEIKEEK